MKKFDLKPFDKVLVRDYDNECWCASLFSNYDDKKEQVFANGVEWMQCVPYEGNEELLGKDTEYVDPNEPKDGDFMKGSNSIFIYNGICTAKTYGGYCGINSAHSVIIPSSESCDNFEFIEDCRHATKGEISNLIEELHKIGKDWDAENKKLIDYRWKPKQGESYWIVNADLMPIDVIWSDNCQYDKDRLSDCNCFATREEAMKMSKKIRALLLSESRKNEN